jgi:hypothetical protein
MPVVVLQEFKIDGDDRSTTNYDAIAEHLGMDTNPPGGMIVHTAGWDEESGVFRIVEVWETQEDSERFRRERLQPALDARLGAGNNAPAPPDHVGSYELHNLISRG